MRLGFWHPLSFGIPFFCFAAKILNRCVGGNFQVLKSLAWGLALQDRVGMSFVIKAAPHKVPWWQRGNIEITSMVSRALAGFHHFLAALSLGLDICILAHGFFSFL
jgi:hypothetical protein